MDLGTIIGIMLGLLVILSAIVITGVGEAYINLPGFLIVIGGATSATLISIPIVRIRSILSVTKKAIFHKARSAADLISELVSYAEVARRDGILSLEAHCKDIDDPFVVRGIQMAVDGTDPELIEQIMETELENLLERHEEGKAIFDALGRYAPAFGMIGTLIGLVSMLMNMQDPALIGEGMAVALLTTLYGALLANLLALPIADKLAKRSAEEALLKTIVVKGVMSIQSGDNPRVVEQKLKTFLPPATRSERSRGEL
ncbi:MAG: MotA/TolQ/ExbB proton channel family protein [Phycisphaeraceae bacterium]|nr:MotA/TolQ/ExbB proton channel family protein [Phycisphaeraceae bacterium]